MRPAILRYLSEFCALHGGQKWHVEGAGFIPEDRSLIGSKPSSHRALSCQVGIFEIVDFITEQLEKIITGRILNEKDK